MAVIHDTTMSPGKLELLTAWLPGQVPLTYRARAPRLAKAGGFRLDDPHGEVGIEFISNTPDPAVTVQLVAGGSLTVTGPAVAADGPSATDLRVETASADGTRRGQLTVRVNRILRPAGGADQPGLSAPWRLPDGAQVRGILATADYNPVPGP